MTTTAIAPILSPETLEKVVMEGDLKNLTAEQRLEYYSKVCESLGLNPLTRPFLYLTLNGKLTLYATKDCTEQLADRHNISIELQAGRTVGDTYVVQARASKETRFADATGVVTIKGLQGDNLANGLMKAETKAARRAVLRLVGLGWLDESEIETIPASVAAPASVNAETGEIQPSSPSQPAPDAQEQSKQTSGGDSGPISRTGEFLRKLNEMGYGPERMVNALNESPVEWLKQAEGVGTSMGDRLKAVTERVDQAEEENKWVEEQQRSDAAQEQALQEMGEEVEETTRT